MPAEKSELTIIVNGKVTTVERNENAPLSSTIEKALSTTDNVGPPENWEFRDESGEVLDASKKIASFNFPSGIKLFLSLKAGAAGSR